MTRTRIIAALVMAPVAIAAILFLPTQWLSAVVALVFLEDRTVADAARVLGCAEETARTHLKRALERLGQTVKAGE